jgi:hypothetical protein
MMALPSFCISQTLPILLLAAQGCQINLYATHQNLEKYVPKDHKIDQMITKFTK